MQSPDDLERLIPVGSPQDADADFYARHCPGSSVHVSRVGDAAGVIVVAEGPLGPCAVLRADDPAAVPSLVAMLPAGRRYIKTLAPLAAALAAAVRLDSPATMRVSWLPRCASPQRQPDVAVTDRAATVRCEGEVASDCRVVWRSATFAEIAIETDPRFRRRGLGRRAVAAISARLLASGVTPLYVADVQNVPSLRLADSLGFLTCDQAEFAGYAG